MQRRKKEPEGALWRQFGHTQNAGRGGSRFRNRRGNPPALLGNNIDGEELESEFSGLCVNSGRFMVLSTLLLFLEDGGVV